MTSRALCTKAVPAMVSVTVGQALLKTNVMNVAMDTSDIQTVWVSENDGTLTGNMATLITPYRSTSLIPFPSSPFLHPLSFLPLPCEANNFQ